MSKQGDARKVDTDEWKLRSSRKRSKHRPFAIEWRTKKRVVNRPFCFEWRIWSHYETRKRRDQAFEQKMKSTADCLFEFRKVDVVE